MKVESLNISEIHFQSGQKEGLHKDYSDTGVLRFEKTYKAGKEEGVTKVYYETGELEYEITFQADTIVAVKCFNKSGNQVPCED